VVRVSGQGDRLWEMALGGGGEEYAVCTAFARDGSLLLAGLSGSEPGGNKTPPLLGDVDAWMIALEPEAPWLDADSAAEGRVTLRLYPGALEAWHAVEASTGFIAWEETARFWAELPRYELTFPAPQSPSFYRLKRLSPGEASRK
jgi:hypothetical protein